MARRKQRRIGVTGLLLSIMLAALLLGGCYFVFLQYQSQQLPSSTASPTAEKSADVLDDERMVYGGEPRPGPAPAAPNAPLANEDLQLHILRNRAYVVGYSEERKDPLWTAYRVVHVEHPFNLPRPTGGFLADARSAAHVKEGDYAHSGYDRGHMAPNSVIARCYGPEAQIETFLLTNICPQSPALNEKVWERLEVEERQYGDRYGEEWVMDGPIFGDFNGGKTNRLASGIAVPVAFYKILVREQDEAAPASGGGMVSGHPRVFAVIMPQGVKGTELPQQFLTSVREIEKETGLNFFWKLDPATQEQVEGKTWAMW